nr:ERAP1-like C-terminal domain-containing protein [Nocardioidaceae bacterium]
ELSEASGRDLAAWTKGWLDTAGTDTLRLAQGADSRWELQAAGPNGELPRPHRLHVGVYAPEGGALVRTDVVDLDVESATTELPALGDSAELLLVNDDDLTFAAVSLDQHNLARLLDSAAQLPDATSRAVAVVTMWDMVVSEELPAREFVRSANAVLAKETTEALVEPFLDLVLTGAERWSPDRDRDDLLGSIAEVCLEMAQDDTRRVVALRGLARAAVTADQLQSLRELTSDDVDLSWRTLIRFAALGQFDEGEVEALRERDPDPDSWLRAFAVEAAQPNAAAKEAAWQVVVDQRKIPVGNMQEVALAFWQPSQPELLAPFAERYLAALPALAGAGMIVAMVTASAMFPISGAGTEFLDRVNAVATSSEVSPLVRQRVLERADQLSRRLRVRGEAG